MEDTLDSVKRDRVVRSRSPMRGERTKRRIPLRVFLSERMARSNAVAGTRGQGGSAPRRRIRATIRKRRQRASSLARVEKSCGNHAQETASPCR